MATSTALPYSLPLARCLRIYSPGSKSVKVARKVAQNRLLTPIRIGSNSGKLLILIRNIMVAVVGLEPTTYGL